MGWFQHRVMWVAGTSSGTMPAPVSVVPTYKLQEAIFKTKAGTRRRDRKGIWGGCKIHWVLEPDELADLDDLLAAENADSDTVPFTLALDGTTYRRAHLAKEPDPKPYGDVNAAVDVTLEFEFVTRLSAVPSPVHLGATS